jgi:hypothetical protein
LGGHGERDGDAQQHAWSDDEQGSDDEAGEPAATAQVQVQREV